MYCRNRTKGLGRAFDLRLSRDPEALADLLPTIDNQTSCFDRQTFVEALAGLSTYLNNPEWMIYQWGSLRPIPCGVLTLVFSLADAVELGIQVICLSKFDNFHKLLEGFSNPSQFQDACFEARVAYWAATLETVTSIRFSPTYVVRGRRKNPEFDAISTVGTISVECKRPHTYAQRAHQKFQRCVDAFKSTMQEKRWPSHLRLEIDLIGPLKESVTALARKTIDEALKRAHSGRMKFTYAKTIHGFVVQRKSPFRISEPKFGTDIMMVQGKATGLFNPESTSLRVVNDRLGGQFAKSVGRRIAEALKQLPRTHPCLIFIGDAPYRIAEEACRRRLSNPAYQHVRGFGVWEKELKFVFREGDGGFIHALLGKSAVRDN